MKRIKLREMVQKSKKIEEIQIGDNDKTILNFEKTKDDILEKLPSISFDDFTALELKVLTNQLQQILYVIKNKQLPNGSLNEDDAFIKNYLPNAIKDFVAKSNTASPYKPQIKLHWAEDNNHEVDTKWLAVTWDMIAKLVDAVLGK